MGFQVFIGHSVLLGFHGSSQAHRDVGVVLRYILRQKSQVITSLSFASECLAAICM